MTNFIHKTVLQKEAVELLNCREDKLYIDATAGGGGHSFEIAQKIYPGGRLIMLDADPDAIRAASVKIEKYKEITTIIRSNYSEIPRILKELNIDKITGGALFDLGVSFYQLTSEKKGFTFSKESPLDMRIDPDNPVNAYDIVNTYSESDLYRIFKEYGEERFSGRIARNIAEKRKITKIKTTTELAGIIIKSVPRTKIKIHPATRVFQALRIEVNQELEFLKKILNEIVPLLDRNARIVVISFHSLEDRLVKNIFKYYSSKCICPPHKMICDCDPPKLKVITKKPIIPSEDELKENPSARSAKMRAAEVII